jgi:hypothetical protein
LAEPIDGTRCAWRKSNPDVLIMQSAQHWPANNVPGPLNPHGAGASLFSDECVCLIVVFHVRQQHVTKMALAYYDDMIDAFPADRTEQPFCVCVRLREK